ncbi:MAG TPA: nucleoside-diphosphate sugar epimerase/dehydratase [Phycisphaerae bacterium]|nr:nucleoside-diphosphate sugar epimerase/dehydratase [Phycisphaerae bacterium]
MRLLRGGWRYSGIRDILRILVASWWFVLISSIFLVLFVYMPDSMGKMKPRYIGDYFAFFPKSVLVLDFMVTVFLVSVARLALRIYYEELRPISPEGLKRVLLVGAGSAGETILRELSRTRYEEYRVVGIVDDDPHKQGLLIHDIPILGKTDDIPRICKENDIREIIIALPSASQKQMKRVINLCSGTKLKFQALPGLSDIISGKVMVSQIRPVDINDLLGRDIVQLDTKAISSFINGRIVLVTGAGGSIGSEMCRQICSYSPQRLIIVEQAETALFDIENELRRNFPKVCLVPRICDIYDRERVMSVWDEIRPNVVIHAAAYKHVPMMEYNPCEAVKTNIFGSKNVADASVKYDVAEFITISTDKAVNPSSIMGCSKRVVEIYTQALNWRENCKTKFKAVRFGNVLGSAGSVVPTFRKQIATGGPVTVTHPDMTRYFMTIPEAAQLVLEAAATGQGGQIFLLDMGEPVKIADLAKQMITLSGFRPGEDIDIVYTGIRPGEKLFEELRTQGEDIEPTVHPKIMIWTHSPIEWEKVQQIMDSLEPLKNTNDRDAVVDALKKAVPEFVPLNPPKK